MQGGTTSAGLNQAALHGEAWSPTAGLKQPSLCCMGHRTLGRRNAALVQGTIARPGLLNCPRCIPYPSRRENSLCLPFACPFVTIAG